MLSREAGPGRQRSTTINNDQQRSTTINNDQQRSTTTTNPPVPASPGQFSLSQSSYAISEDGGSLLVTVHRTGGSDGTVTVQYQTSDGASGAGWNQYAWSGSQYGSQNGTLTFNPGETSKTISIPIYDNTSVSVDKLFTVTLKNAAGGATLGSITQAVVTIGENDSAIEFVQSSYSVSEDDGYVTIRLVRNGSSAGSASINLNVSSWGAGTGTDYSAPSNQTVTLADGQTTTEVKIAILDDAFAESTEWFGMSLSNATGASLGNSLWGSVQIHDND